MDGSRHSTRREQGRDATHLSRDKPKTESMMAAIYLPKHIDPEDLKIQPVDWLAGIRVPAYDYPKGYVKTWLRLLGI